MGGDEVFEYVEVEHHTQEYEQGEDHEVFHRVAIEMCIRDRQWRGREDAGARQEVR